MVRFIFGGPAAGKTRFCALEMLEEQSKLKEAAGFAPELIYIVPEQFSLDSEKLLIKASGGVGIMKAKVLSFNRLAYYIFRERGGIGTKILEDFGKGMLVRKVLLNLGGSLNYYGSAASTQGFIENISDIITEFYKYGIMPDDLRNAAGNLASRSEEGLKLRLYDLCAIYKSYREYMAANYISSEETLDILSDQIKDSAFLTGANIWVDGFKGFTPQEYKVLKALMKKCNKLSFAFNVDADRSFAGRFEKLAPHDPYYEVKRAINKLSDIADESSVFFDAPVFLNRENKNFGEASYLKDNYFSYSKSGYTGEITNISLFEADNIYAETQACARNITSLTRDHGLRHNEIGIITPDLKLYSKPLKTAFARFKIPLFVDEKKEVLSHPLAELCRGALKLVTGGFAYENVFRALKTGLLPVTAQETDRLENYVIAYGIKSYGWQREWAFGFGGLKGDEEKAYLNEIRIKVLDIFKPVTSALSRGGKYKVKKLCAVLYAFIDGCGAKEKIKEWTLQPKGDPGLLLFHSQIWGKFTELLDKAVEIFVEETFTASEFLKIIEAGFSSMSAGIAPPTLDHINAGELTHSRLSEVKALFILGVNEGLMPSRMTNEGLLSDKDRESLNFQGLELAGTLVSKAYEEQLYIYEALAKPSEKLYLSYHTGSLDGKTMLPSQVIDRIMSLFPGLRAERESASFSRADSITAPDPTFAALSKELRSFEGNPPPVYCDAYSYFKQNSRYSGKIAVMERILADNGAEMLTDDDIRELYGKKGKNLILGVSASRLETYVRCPFSYFARYNLKAEERKLYEMENVDIGNIFHAVLEKFSKRIYEEKIDLENIENEKLFELAGACVEEAAAEGSNDILQSSGRYRHYKERLKEISGRSIWALSKQLKAGKFSIYQTEAAFSDDGAITFDLGEGNLMSISGRVDRIDAMANDKGEYLKVIDYKSGSKSFSFTEIFYGLQLQLIIYMNAILKQHGVNSFPAAIFYFRILNPILNYFEDLEGKNEAELETALENEILKAFKMSGVVLEDMDIIKSLDGGFERHSSLMPVSLKSGGAELGANSSTLSYSGFTKLMAFAVEKAKEIGREILSGNISVSPSKYKEGTACQYCEYKPLCRYDLRIDQEKLRRFSGLGEKDAKEKITGDKGRKESED